MSLPSPRTVKALYGSCPTMRDHIAKARSSLRSLLSGQDSRIAIISGPCSIHHIDSAIEYAHRLKQLAKKVEKTCWLAMRVYIEKPRSTSGWKGFLYDPHLDGSHDLQEGILQSRKLFLELAKMEVPIAMEFLDPLASGYVDDLVSWGFIGARTSASQIHRQLASSLEMPVGFKNSVDGNIEHAIFGALSAQSPHTFFSVDTDGMICETQSQGNPDTHIVLRGSDLRSNYDSSSIRTTSTLQRKLHLNSRILVDCSHGNSRKNHLKQPEIFQSVLEQILEKDPSLLGMMLESHLEAGHQRLSEDVSSVRGSVSITDPCIGWESTEELVLSADELLSSLLSGSSFGGSAGGSSEESS